MANVIGLKQGDYQVNGAKDGAFYDSCPSAECGRRDIERSWKIGGGNAQGEQYLNAAIYSCSPKEGGCGATWTRTTRQGVVADAARGVKSKWGTRNVNATLSVPSEAYRRNFDLIDWGK